MYNDDETKFISKEDKTSEIIFDLKSVSEKKTYEALSHTINDLEEFKSFQTLKRNEFEQHVGKNRLNYKQWLQYARWEIENSHDYARTRSIYERALKVDFQYVPFWTHYVKFELINKNVNHARNLLERAISILPKENSLWFLYVQQEEILKNYQGVRNIFDKWITWHPDTSVWNAYISFEKRYHETDKIRNLFQKYISDHPSGNTWIKWVSFEKLCKIDLDQIQRIRSTFELCLDTMLSDDKLKDDDNIVDLVVMWTDWEASCNEYERGEAIFTNILNNNFFFLSEPKLNDIYKAYKTFKKVYFDQNDVESDLFIQSKLNYEHLLKEYEYDSDLWLKYINICQFNNDLNTVKTLFKKSITYIPNDNSKTIKWKRYIFLWIKYALWEEFTNKDIMAAKKVWDDCLTLLKKKKITFGKIWIHIAQFHLRNDGENGLMLFRKILGTQIGQSNTFGLKNSIFKYYINFEKKIGEFDRVRKLYRKWIELIFLDKNKMLTVNNVIFDYLEFEKDNFEYKICDSIINMVLDLIEKSIFSHRFNSKDDIWIFFINYYKERLIYDKCRFLYRKLLKSIIHPNLWISFALFESSVFSPDQIKMISDKKIKTNSVNINDYHLKNTRAIFNEAVSFYEKNHAIEFKYIVLESWYNYEKLNGSEESISNVKYKLIGAIDETKQFDDINEKFSDNNFQEYESEKSTNVVNLNKFIENAKKMGF